MNRLRLWLARWLLRDLPYVVLDQDSYREYRGILAAQTQFYRLIELNPHLKTTAVLLHPEPTRFQ